MLESFDERMRDLKSCYNSRGVVATIQLLLFTFLDSFFDRIYKINSANVISPKGRNSSETDSSNLYIPTRGFAFKDLIKHLGSYKGYSFVDVCCGQGRTLFIAGRSGFKHLVGVDIDEQLIKQAEINLIGLNATKIDLYHMNALDFEPLKTPAIYYLYDPFDDQTLRQFFLNLKDGCSNSQFLIVYHNNIRIPDALDIFGSLLPWQEVTFKGSRFFIWDSSKVI